MVIGPSVKNQSCKPISVSSESSSHAVSGVIAYSPLKRQTKAQEHGRIIAAWSPWRVGDKLRWWSAGFPSEPQCEETKECSLPLKFTTIF